MFKLLIAAALAAVGVSQYTLPPSGNMTNSTTFTNPIIGNGADPWMFRHEDYYYLTYTNNVNVTLWRSKSLTDWADAESKTIFHPEPDKAYSTDLWAPEMHQIDGSWWVIFTADPNHDSPPPEVEMWCEYNCPAVNHRMFVAVGDGEDPWTTSYRYHGELETYDQFAIDGTYFQHADQLYHIYSCWYRKYDGWPANLCITKMSDPYTTVSPFSERQIISVPEYAWEKTPFNRSNNDRLSSNEGPQQLVNPTTGQNFLIYSAARSDNRNYCLGQLELIGDNPMNPSDWRKHPYPVFYQNPNESAYGVGHASFTTSLDGTEDWIIYHGMKDPTNGWSARTIRAQKFGWKEDGSPDFPRPGYGPYKVPSGQ